ncbi:hypothetical protein CZP2022_252 [Vibrio phage C-ZP2022]|nr:hypothetical protein CZP2022_252 [Vibrio phage C-ZP2022]
MNTHIYDLLKEDIQHVVSTNHVLARAWRYLLFQLQVPPSGWDTLLTTYISKARDFKGQKEATNLKGNLPKRLACEEVTFKNLCRGISVFNFHKTMISLDLVKDGVEKTLEIEIPPTFDEKGGRYLKVLWLKMIKEFPHCTENWKEHVDKYRQYCKEVEGLEVDAVSNLPRSLDAEALTWNSFYKGLLIHDFDGIKFSITVYKRSAPKVPISIQLVIKKP